MIQVTNQIKNRQTARIQNDCKITNNFLSYVKTSKWNFLLQIRKSRAAFKKHVTFFLWFLTHPMSHFCMKKKISYEAVTNHWPPFPSLSVTYYSNDAQVRINCLLKKILYRLCFKSSSSRLNVFLYFFYRKCLEISFLMFNICAAWCVSFWLNARPLIILKANFFLSTLWHRRTF